eukprot:gene5575-6137_t
MMDYSEDWKDPETITDDIAPWWKYGRVFLRSTTKKQNNNKYMAKCRGCGHVCRGELGICASHAINCKSLSKEQKQHFERSERKVGNSELKKRNAFEALGRDDLHLLLKGAILQNVSIRALIDENPYFRSFFENHKIELPDHKKVKMEIDEIYTTMRNQILDELAGRTGLTLMIHGGWSSSSDDHNNNNNVVSKKNGIFVFMLADNETEYFVDLLDVPSETHYTNNAKHYSSAADTLLLFQKCSQILQDANLTWDAISAFTTDNPTIMTSLRDTLKSHSDGRIICIPCSLQKFNSLTGDIVNTAEYVSTFKASSAIVNFIHRSYRWNYQMKVEKKNNPNIKDDLIAYVYRRWFTAGLLVRGLNSFSTRIQKLTEQPLFAQSLKDKKITLDGQERMLSELMTNNNFYNSNNNLSIILNPIITVMTHNETRSSTIDEIFVGFLHIDYYLKKAICEEGVETTEFAEKILEFVFQRALDYTSDFIFTLALLLNPKYCSVARSSKSFNLKQEVDVLKQINTFVTEHGWTSVNILNWTSATVHAEQCKGALIKYLRSDFSIFTEMKGFAVHPFWSTPFNDFLGLQPLVLEVFKVRSSTAIAESTFSALKQIKSEISNQMMSIETLKKRGIVQFQLRKEMNKPIDPPLKSIIGEYQVEYDECDEDEIKETDLPDSFFDEDFKTEGGVSVMDRTNILKDSQDPPNVKDRLRKSSSSKSANRVVNWKAMDKLGMGKLFDVSIFREIMEGKKRVIQSSTNAAVPVPVPVGEPVVMDLTDL